MDDFQDKSTGGAALRQRRKPFPLGTPDPRGEQICRSNAGLRARMHANSRAAAGPGARGLVMSQADLQELLLAVVGLAVALGVLAAVAAKRFVPRAAARRSAAEMRAEMLLAAELRNAEATRALREGFPEDEAD